jgi:chromosome segregation ATPase
VRRAADAETKVNMLNAELAAARAEAAAAKAELAAVKAELQAAHKAAKEAMEDVSPCSNWLIHCD